MHLRQGPKGVGNQRMLGTEGANLALQVVFLNGESALGSGSKLPIAAIRQGDQSQEERRGFAETRRRRVRFQAGAPRQLHPALGRSTRSELIAARDSVVHGSRTADACVVLSKMTYEMA
jgi:hypothetical protein